MNSNSDIIVTHEITPTALKKIIFDNAEIELIKWKDEIKCVILFLFYITEYRLCEVTNQYITNINNNNSRSNNINTKNNNNNSNNDK